MSFSDVRVQVPPRPPNFFSSSRTSYIHGRVVELVDSLDSGSSVHYGRAGSSPASPTKRSKHYRCDFQEVDIYGVLFLFSGVLESQKLGFQNRSSGAVFENTIDIFL